MSIGWCRPWFAPHWDAKTEGAWAAAVLLRRAGFPHPSGAVSTWAECERLLPHVLAVANHGRRLDVVNAVWRLCCVGRGAVWAVRVRHENRSPLQPVDSSSLRICRLPLPIRSMRSCLTQLPSVES
jgi:hypothetical protein